MNNNYSLEGKIIETNRRYSAANKFFEQGVGLGLTSYNQLITISSVALGFLFSIKTEVIGNGLDLQGQKAFFFYSFLRSI